MHTIVNFKLIMPKFHTEHLRRAKKTNLIYNVFMKSIGRRIKQLRQDLGLSQRKLAPLLGIHWSQLARYEVEKNSPSVETLVQISKTFKKSTDYLIFGKDEKMSKETKIKDHEILELLKKVDKLDKNAREKVKWAIQSLLSNLPK